MPSGTVHPNSIPPLAVDIAARVKALIDAGHRGEAVELFQSEAVGIPRPVVEQMRNAPFRPALEAMAHALLRSQRHDGRARSALATCFDHDVGARDRRRRRSALDSS